MKLNLNKTFLDLDGLEIENSNQGKTLSQALSSSFDAKDTDVMKYWGWAVAFHKGDVVDLDKADQVKLKDFIEKAQFNVLVKHQLLENLNQIETKK